MDELENKSDEELEKIVLRGINLLPHVPQSESNRAKRLLDYRKRKTMNKQIKKSEKKLKLVEELNKYFKAMDVVKLYEEPEHKTSKDWLAEVAAILKNLDETDYRKFLEFRQHLHGSIVLLTRKHAAEQIDSFIREKVAEYKRYDFSYLDEESISDRMLLKDSGFWKLIHNNIAEVSKSRFESEHYADSVEAAFKEIEEKVSEIVKEKRGEELSGASLMRTAFSPKNPVIILDTLDNQSGRDIQQGYMDLFAGAMTGVRNPKAHRNISISKDSAIHLIFLASLLFHNLDNGTTQKA